MANNEHEQQQEDPKVVRALRRKERMKRVNEGRATKRVRVIPRDDVVRRDIKHMPQGIRFPAQGSVEWPLDQFTKRRLRDGTVTLEGAEAQQAREQERQQSRDEHRQRHQQPSHRRSEPTPSREPTS